MGEEEPKYIGDFITSPELEEFERRMKKLPLRERICESIKRMQRDSERDNSLLEKAKAILEEQKVVHFSED